MGTWRGSVGSARIAIVAKRVYAPPSGKTT
jgi:hypothetical protein